MIFRYIVLFSLLSGVLSLAGGLLLLKRPALVRRFSIHFVSFAVGAFLGTAFLDILPEAFALAAERPESLFSFVLAGILLFFVLERLIFRFHPHHHTDDGLEHHHATPILLLVGDTLHNFIDGAVIALAFLTDISLGIITALAVAAHELPQEMSDFSVMLNHGWKKAKVFWANVGSAFANLIGAVGAYLARDFLTPALAPLLAITAGIFIYIASADLIPELSTGKKPDKTSHVLLLVFLGVAVVAILKRLLE